MLAYVVTLRTGRRYTIRAAEMRFGFDRGLELLAAPPAANGGQAGKQVVALFPAADVESVVATEFLVSEEKTEPSPHVVQRDDQIPF